MFDDNKRGMIIALLVMVGCLAAVVTLGEHTPEGIKPPPGFLGQALLLVGGIAMFVAFRAGRAYMAERKEEEARAKSTEQVADEDRVLRARLARGRWFVAAAGVWVALFLVTSIPALVRLTGMALDIETSGKILFATMFFLPLTALLFIMPLVSSLERSVLKWGLALVLVPFGALIISAVILHLAREEVALRDKWAPSP